MWNEDADASSSAEDAARFERRLRESFARLERDPAAWADYREESEALAEADLECVD